MTDLERALEGEESDPLAVLARADLLEEAGRWEEAACLRLYRWGDACTWHEVPGGMVWANLVYLEVAVWPPRPGGPVNGECWTWRPVRGWRYAPRWVGGLWQAGDLPARARALVEAAVRQGGCTGG